MAAFLDCHMKLECYMLSNLMVGEEKIPVVRWRKVKSKRMSLSVSTSHFAEIGPTRKTLLCKTFT